MVARSLPPLSPKRSVGDSPPARYWAGSAILNRVWWSITPGGLLSVALIALLVGCAPFAPRGDAASLQASECVLGVRGGERVMSHEVFRDPVDSLITAAIDSQSGSWQCPAGERS
jgi:hypothetical protein